MTSAEALADRAAENVYVKLIARCAMIIAPLLLAQMMRVQDKNGDILTGVVISSEIMKRQIEDLQKANADALTYRAQVGPKRDAQIEAVNDKLEAQAVRLTRIETVQETMSKSLDRIEQKQNRQRNGAFQGGGIIPQIGSRD